jgi:hypothetical protein
MGFHEICYSESYFTNWSLDSSVDMATGWTARVRFPAWQDFFLFTSSRPTLGPIQLSVKWVSGAISPGVRRPGREGDYAPSSAEVKDSGAIPPPIRLHGIVLNYLITGTALAFTSLILPKAAYRA